MRLKNLIEYKIQNVSVKFEAINLYNNKQVMSIITNTGKRFIIDASIKDFEYFKNWPKGTEKKYVDVEIKPTIKNIKTIDGDRIRTVKIKTEFELPNKNNNKEEEDNNDLVF